MVRLGLKYALSRCRARRRPPSRYVRHEISGGPALVLPAVSLPLLVVVHSVHACPDVERRGNQPLRRLQQPSVRPPSVYAGLSFALLDPTSILIGQEIKALLSHSFGLVSLSPPLITCHVCSPSSLSVQTLVVAVKGVQRWLCAHQFITLKSRARHQGLSRKRVVQAEGGSRLEV